MEVEPPSGLLFSPLSGFINPDEEPGIKGKPPKEEAMKTAMTAGEHVRKTEDLLYHGNPSVISMMQATAHALAACAIELGEIVRLGKVEANEAPSTKPQPE